MLVLLASTGAVAAACGGSPADTSSSAPVSAATLEQAEAELSNPPPVSATKASTLPGVATWAIRPASTGGEVVLEGLDPAQRSVVLLAIAHGAPSEDLGVAFWSDGKLGTTFEAVRIAVGRDLGAASGGIEPKVNLLPGQVPALVSCTGMTLVDLKKCGPTPCDDSGQLVFHSGDFASIGRAYCYSCAHGGGGGAGTCTDDPSAPIRWTG